MSDVQLDRLYYLIDADTGPYEKKMAGLGKAADQGAGTLKKHLSDAAGHAEHLGRGIEVSRRELLYFAREIATGDMARLPSTLVLIGSHMAGITSEAIIMGGTIIAPFALMATAAFQAEKAQERVRTALAATGYQAGITSSQIGDMAKKLGADPNSGLSERGAMDVLGILAKGGNVPGSTFMTAGPAIAGYSRISGLGQDKSAEAISRMMADPAKAANELHDEFHLLSDAEVERIQGMQSRAEQESAIFERLKTRGDAATDSLWTLSRAFDATTTYLASIWYNFGVHVGPQSRGDQMATLRSELGGAGTAGGRHPYTPDQANQMRMQLTQLRAQEVAENYIKNQGYNTANADERRERELSPGALEISRYRDAARIAGLPQEDRAGATAKADAQRQYLSNLNNPDMVKFAEGIKKAQEAAAAADQQAKYRDQAENEGIEIGRRATEELRNRMDAETDYIRSQQTAVANIKKGEITSRLQGADKRDRSLGYETGVTALENQMAMAGKSDDATRRAIALLKEKNDLIEDGWNLEDAAGQAELAMREKQINAQQDQLDIQKELNEQQQKQLSVANDMIDLLGSVLDDPKNAGKILAKGLEHEALTLGVINPLKNAATKAITHKDGTLPTFGDILGGGPLGSPSNPMNVVIVKDMSGGGQGGAAGGSSQDGMGFLGSIMRMIAGDEISKATPGIQSGAVDVVSQAVSRGFALGA